ncbi:type II toxin-antitoxin system HicA family toxin [Neokomagataea thailandica]|uniref:type II toxin-antitoxin system HicA family toxin n=1 Tax=Neokomagataea TaxID=1223423 RepID=UPI0009FF4A4B|nr:MULTISPECIES: type II toxin-antitoxin system HicA family toxin [Neokomagataea]
MDSAKLLRELKKAGWEKVRCWGSYRIFKHREHGHSVTVSHPKKDLGGGVVAVIRKQARLK